MAKRWKHWVRVVQQYGPEAAEKEANAIIDAEDFDVVVPRVGSGDEGWIIILLAFRKQVEVDADS